MLPPRSQRHNICSILIIAWMHRLRIDSRDLIALSSLTIPTDK